MQKYGNLYNFLTNAVGNTSLNNVKLLQVGFLDDLMDGFSVYRNINAANSARDLYLYLLENPRISVYDLFLNTATDKYNKEIYLQVQKLFSSMEDIFKKLTNKGIINNDFNQSSIVKQKYKKSIVKKTKLEPELKPKFEESIAERNILENRDSMKLLQKKK